MTKTNGKYKTIQNKIHYGNTPVDGTSKAHHPLIGIIDLKGLKNDPTITAVIFDFYVVSVELTYSRTKIPTEMERQIFEQHLPFMLEEIKKLSEE